MKMQKTALPAWRDWTLFGLKWILMILFGLAVVLTRPQAAADPLNSLLPPLVVAVVANALLAVVLLLHIDAAVPSVVVLGDVVTLAALMPVIGSSPLLVVGVAGGLLLSGILRLGPLASAVHAGGLLAAVVVMQALASNAAGQPVPLPPDFPVVLVLLFALALLAVGGSYALDRQIGGQQTHITQLTKGETAQLVNMRERARAIYELATTISSTLNYDKILNAVLDAGRLGLRDGDAQSLTSAVLLFRAGDDGLYVAASRRFTRNDEKIIVPGAKGVIAETLQEATAVFVSDVRNDPELQYFTAFQFAHSVMSVPLRAGFDNYGVLLYGSENPNAFDEEQAELLSAIGSQATVAMQNAVLYSSLLNEKERLVEVEEDARKKLARDLHDGPTQGVAAIAMRINYIYRLFEREPAQVPEELQKVEELARRTAKEIRHMLFTLRPLVLETQGLGPALKQLGEKMQETHGQAVAVRLGRDIESLIDPQQQGVLFYIVEEAVNNARKHARADLITVKLGRQDQALICQISDNGVGFDTKAVNTNYEKRGSLGMVNMRERVEMLKGSFRIDSLLGKGTSITIYIPIQAQVAAAAPARNGKVARPQTKLALAAIERYDGGR